jgi:hypothetical protein
MRPCLQPLQQQEAPTRFIPYAYGGKRPKHETANNVWEPDAKTGTGTGSVKRNGNQRTLPKGDSPWVPNNEGPAIPHPLAA